MIIKSEYICINFQMNISTTVQYVKVLTSNHSWAPAGSQADKPPFLLCIINIRVMIKYVKKQATKKKKKAKQRKINKVASELVQKMMRVYIYIYIYIENCKKFWFFKKNILK